MTWWEIFLAYVGGLLLIALDLIVPSGGLLTVLGAGILFYAFYYIFVFNDILGLFIFIATGVGIWKGVLVYLTNWHRTPMGRYLAPPYEHTEADKMPLPDLQATVGKVGITLTPLRPVGFCLFDGKKIECVSYFGVIQRETEVEAVGLIERTISVRPIPVEGKRAWFRASRGDYVAVGKNGRRLLIRNAKSEDQAKRAAEKKLGEIAGIELIGLKK